MAEVLKWSSILLTVINTEAQPESASLGAAVHRSMALCYLQVRDMDGALREAERAVELCTGAASLVVLFAARVACCHRVEGVSLLDEVG